MHMESFGVLIWGSKKQQQQQQQKHPIMYCSFVRLIFLALALAPLQIIFGMRNRRFLCYVTCRTLASNACSHPHQQFV